MEFYSKNPAMEEAQSDPQMGWNSQAPETGLEEPMLQLGFGTRDSYPERPGEPNCLYYMRTGTCGYGARCRYHHPRYHTMATGGGRQGREEYPEREGQPVCQYYLKTGTCKFGASCKYHHPKNGGGSLNPVPLNYYGYPLRPGELECSYYVKTGNCKFGVTCKFHHPQPTSTSVPAPAAAIYPTASSPSPSLPSPSQQYGGVGGSWQAGGRPTLLPGSYVQGAYGPMLLSPGMVPIPAWNPYHASLNPAASPGNQPTVGANPLYGVTQLSPSAQSYQGPYQPLQSSSAPSSSSQKETTFPERPGLPECQYYMRTGDCKFGSTCRYHHPSERISVKTSCALSPIGLPLRPGAAPCTFYTQHGICRFGPTCRFDHPMGALSYSPSASSLSDIPVAPYPIGSSLATLAPSSSSSELRPEFAVSIKDPFSSRMPSSENTSSHFVGSTFSKSASVSHSIVQLSGQSSGLSRGGNSESSSDQGGEVRTSC